MARDDPGWRWEVRWWARRVNWWTMPWLLGGLTMFGYSYYVFFVRH